MLPLRNKRLKGIKINPCRCGQGSENNSLNQEGFGQNSMYNLLPYPCSKPSFSLNIAVSAREIYKYGACANPEIGQGPFVLCQIFLAESFGLHNLDREQTSRKNWQIFTIFTSKSAKIEQKRSIKYHNVNYSCFLSSFHTQFTLLLNTSIPLPWQKSVWEIQPPEEETLLNPPPPPLAELSLRSPQVKSRHPLRRKHFYTPTPPCRTLTETPPPDSNSIVSFPSFLSSPFLSLSFPLSSLPLSFLLFLSLFPFPFPPLPFPTSLFPFFRQGGGTPLRISGTRNRWIFTKILAPTEKKYS